MSLKWEKDKHDCWNLHIGRAHVWIEPRPAYCDRGHYIAKCAGVPNIDGQDGFPRYFMRIDCAKMEMAEWLQWKLEREGLLET